MAKANKRKADRRERFVKELVANGGNATQAAIAAGYSTKTAASQASRLLRDPDICKMRQEEAKTVYDGLGICAQSLALELEEIKRRCMTAVPHMTWNAETKQYEEDGTWIFDAKGAISAIKQEATMMGIAPPEDAARNKIAESVDEFIRRMGQGEHL